MIEILLKSFLEKETNTKTYLVLPDKKPDSFITLEKIGSSNINNLDSSIFAIQSWANSMYEAAKLNQQIKKLLQTQFMELENISKANINSDYNFTDTTTKKYRYQMVVEIFHY